MSKEIKDRIKIKTAFKLVQDRAIVLKSNNQNLEAFLLYIFMIEMILKTCINIQSKLFFMILGNTDLKTSYPKEHKFVNSTFGRIIELFSVYCNDKKLIPALSRLNTMRNKIVHNIFDEDIEKLNIEAGNLLDKTYNPLLQDLTLYSIKLETELDKRLKK